MLIKRFSRCLLALMLVVTSVITPITSFAFTGIQQTAATQSQSTDLTARLAALEKELEAKRQETGVVGLSLVIVKDDKVVFMKGMGYKDFEHKLPVTPETLFAIGSSTKAFTAMSAMMSVDDGKLSLDDSPKKYLPYFKLQDPEADEKITVRDLMCHSSGLNRTDLPWISGVFTREEIIRIAGQAKPTAKFREKFQYQNIMFAAAGEIVAKVQNQPWETVIKNRLFKPLGMDSSNLSKQETEKSKDYALGYQYIPSTKVTTHLPMRDITRIGPAGSINSNARDMAQWVRLMLNGGTFAGKQLVSEKSYGELIKQQMKVAGTIGYGLGWFIRDWNGHKAYDHGGNIDGFSSMVAFMPDQKLGFAYLSNANASPLAETVRGLVWKHLVGEPEANKTEAKADGGSDGEKKVDAQSEAGTYRLTQANMDIEFKFSDGKFTAIVPGQPNYPLENVGGRRYKLGSPAPDGFFVTFRPVKDKASETEAYLEQPQGNFVLTRITTEKKAEAEAATANYSGPMKELIGSYQSESGNGPMLELKLIDSKVALVVPGQPAYPLKEVEKDLYGAMNLPDTYRIGVKRDESGKVTSIALKQPNGEFSFKRLPETKIELTVDQIMAKVIEAAGGEANLRKHKTMMMTASIDFEHQGVTGEAVNYAKAPNLSSSDIAFMALGRKFGTVYEYFDGQAGGEGGSFVPSEKYAGKNLEDKRIAADFYQLLNWKSLYKTVEIKRMTKLGNEDVYVIAKTPEKGNPVTDYISAKTFTLLKRESLNTTNSGEMTLPSTEIFSDYRNVDGVVLPFKVVTNNASMGDMVVQVKEIKFDVEVPDSAFKARTK